MTDRPIIFSAPMVRALLDGRKTQTRRVTRGPEGHWFVDPNPRGEGIAFVAPEGSPSIPIRLPYATGDRLYVREAFAMDPAVRRPDRAKNVMYRADVPATEPPTSDVLTMDRLMWSGAQELKWKPSIHMPRWASRLTLTVTDVRVQRLQDISEADAVAEGIVPVTRRFPPLQGCPNQLRERTIYEWSGGWSVRAADAYAVLWNSLHGADAWDANPWCVAISFTVQKGNIDQVAT